MMTAEKSLWIERKPTVCFGKPVIKGTRIPIGVILGALADGMTMKEVADAYQIPPEAVQAALEYAAGQIKKALMDMVSDISEEGAELSRKDARRILKLLAKLWL